MATAAIMLTMMMSMLTSCTSRNDNPTSKVTDVSALVGTWYTDLTGKTHFQWNEGPALNVWTFQADGTGVCDVFFTANDQPKAIEHQPFTYTIDGDIMTFVMEDSTWDGKISMADGKLTIDAGGSAITFNRADAEQKARFEEWSKMELMQVTPTPTK